MKFTEIFLSSAELCYFDRNKKMKPSSYVNLYLDHKIFLKNHSRCQLPGFWEQYSQLFQLPQGNIFPRGILEEDSTLGEAISDRKGNTMLHK